MDLPPDPVPLVKSPPWVAIPRTSENQPKHFPQLLYRILGISFRSQLNFPLDHEVLDVSVEVGANIAIALRPRACCIPRVHLTELLKILGSSRNCAAKQTDLNFLGSSVTDKNGTRTLK